MSVRPAVVCRPDDLHVTETDRLWIVTSRATDLVRYYRMRYDDPDDRRDMAPEMVAQAATITLGPVADLLDSAQPLLPVDPNVLFFAGIDRASHHLVAGLSLSSSGLGSEIGGTVRHGLRAQGYGHEMLTTVCALVHRHFGIARVFAGCEVSNTASRRWLAKAGFVATPGPATFTLPSGRKAETLWWEHVDPDAELRCRRPRPR